MIKEGTNGTKTFANKKRRGVEGKGGQLEEKGKRKIKSYHVQVFPMRNVIIMHIQNLPLHQFLTLKKIYIIYKYGKTHRHLVFFKNFLY